MSRYEVKIKTKLGELTVHFDDTADLKNKLSQIPEITTALEESIGPILMRESEKVIQGLEDIYTIGSDGLVRLLKFPKKKTELMRLASFLSPFSLTPAQLRSITGEHNPAAYMMPKDFIENPDGTFTLSSDARAEVASKTIPSLRASTK